MLNIIINGEAMDYSEDIAITFTVENPMLSEDGSVPVPFTSTIDLLPTSHNYRVFGHPQRLNNVHNRFIEYDCQIVFDGLVISGIYKLDSCADRLEGMFTASEALSLTKSKATTTDTISQYVGNGYSDYDTDTVWIEGYPEIPDDDYLRPLYVALSDMISDLVNQENSTGKLSPIVFAPIKMKGQDYEPLLLVQFDDIRRMFINPFLPANGGFIYSNSSSGGLCMGAMMPAFRLGYLMDKMFGGRLDNNVFNQGEMQKVVLQALHHPKLQAGEVGYPFFPNLTDDDRRYYNASKFLPEMSRMDVVKEVLKIFCMSLYTENGRFKLYYNRDIITSTEVVDLARYNPKIISVGRQTGRYYQYGYSDNEYKIPNRYQSRGTPEAIWKTIPGTITENLYETSRTGQFFMVKKGSTKTQLFDMEVFISGFQDPIEPDIPEDADIYDVVSSITPMDNTYHNIWYGGPGNSKPIGDGPGPGYNSLFIPEVEEYATSEDFPRIMLFHGYKRYLSSGDYSATYPFMSGKNVGPDGESLGDITLEYDAPLIGLYPRYHKPFAEWVEKDKGIAEAEMYITPDFLSSLRMDKKYAIESKVYFIKELSVEIRRDRMGAATLDLIEA